MNPDIEGLKAYIGGLVLDLFAAQGAIKALQQRLAEAEKAKSKENGNDAS